MNNAMDFPITNFVGKVSDLRVAVGYKPAVQYAVDQLDEATKEMVKYIQVSLSRGIRAAILERELHEMELRLKSAERSLRRRVNAHRRKTSRR